MRIAEFGITPILATNRMTMACLFPKQSEDGEYASAESYRALYRRYAVLPVQTHSLNIGVVEYPHQFFENTDALVSFRPDIPVGVVTADCVPLLIYAPDVDGRAAVHAGWKGTIGGIVDNTLDILMEHGADPEKMIVVIGPAIHVESYEVDRDLAERFTEAGFGEFVVWPNGEHGKPHLDLIGVNRERLLRRGIPEGNIIIHPADTFGFVDTDGFRFPSYRRSGGSPLRMLSFIS